VRIDAEGHEVNRQVERVLTQQLAVVDRGQRVQVGDEVVRLVAMLQVDVLPDGGKIISPVDSTGRLNAGKYAHGL
jgi:hypothetical protein